MTSAAHSVAFEFVVSLVAAWILVDVIRRVLLRRGLLDVPNARSSHAAPTPRGGGIAIVIVTMVAVVLAFAAQRLSGSWSIAWLAGGGMVAVVGFVDDLRGLSALARGAIHILAAIMLLNAVDIPAVWTSMGLGAAWFWVPPVILGLVVVWSTNLFNFMDGIDGLAAAQCVFVVLAGAALSGTGQGSQFLPLPFLAMGGACAGFLIWNAPPAKIFMGDVGSGFIGFGLIAGALASSGRGPIGPWAWLILNGLFVVDATVTVATRLLRSERIYEAHRSHVYQRLARRWNSHGRVTIAYQAINLGWCLPWAFAATRLPGDGPLLVLGALLPMIAVALAAGAGRPD